MDELGRLMACLIWTLQLFLVVYAETHQYIAYQIISPNITSLPTFICISQLNDIPTRYYDSKSREVVPLNDYNLAEESPMVLKRHSVQCQMWEQQHLHDYGLILEEISKHKYSKDSAYIQIIKGCELNTDTDKMDGFTQYALNGKDFLSTTWSGKSWEATHPAAKKVAEIWNSEEEKANDHRVMSRTFCHYIINKNLETLSWRTANPAVSILPLGVVSSVPSSLLCHVTMFYPRDIEVIWERNGISLQNEQRMKDILPNGDLTYQVSVEIETHHSPSEYTCVVRHKSLDRDIKMKWDPPRRLHLFVLLLLAVVILLTFGGFCVWKYKQKLNKGKYIFQCNKYDQPHDQRKS